MIVTSGALVLVALALLIGGLASSGLGLVWASIAVSLVSAVFLAVGVYQRRNDVPGLEVDSPVVPVKTDEVEGVRTVTSPVGGAVGSGQDVAGGGQVLVVPGRPRYHAAGCRYLTGKQAEERSLGAAQAEGYSACGVCKPEEAAAQAAAPEPASSVRLTSEATVADATSAAAAKKAPARAAATKPAASKSAATKSAATKKAAPAKTTATKKAATKTTATKTAATKTAATKTTATTTAVTKSATTKKVAAKTTATKAAATKKAAAKKTAR